MSDIVICGCSVIGTPSSGATVTCSSDPEDRLGSRGVFQNDEGTVLSGAFYFGRANVINAASKGLTVFGCSFYAEVPTKWDVLGWFRLFRWLRQELLIGANSLGAAIARSKELDSHGY